MNALSTPGATTTSTPPPNHTPAPMHHPRRWGQVGYAVRPMAIAAAVTAAIALTGTINRPAVTLTSTDAIDLGQGISVTPAPGWTIGNAAPGWVRLHNTYATAEMEIKVKPTDGTDPVTVLQADINQLSNVSTTGLTNVKDLSAPATRALQSGKFPQEAYIAYSADGTSRMGAIPVVGSFIELLNSSNHQSAFIVFARNADATTSAVNEGAAMIDSML
jgi:hypothetical protein